MTAAGFLLCGRGQAEILEQCCRKLLGRVDVEGVAHCFAYLFLQFFPALHQFFREFFKEGRVEGDANLLHLR